LLLKILKIVQVLEKGVLRLFGDFEIKSNPIFEFERRTFLIDIVKKYSTSLFRMLVETSP
jgi:hypothetical protein